MSSLEHLYFPIHRLGYRCNPFRALTFEEWQELAVLPEAFSPLLDNLPPLTQILGDKGTGKTSTLLALNRELSSREKLVCYEYIPVGSNYFMEDLSDVEIYLLDEAQRLAPRWINKLLRAPTVADDYTFSLIVSTHKDLSNVVISKGISTVTVLLGNPSRQFIETFIMKRLEYFERSGVKGVRLAPEALDQVITHSGPDLRLIEKILYEAYQTWGSTDAIQEEHLQGIIARLH